MPHPRRRKLHKCKNHHRVAARGRCARCGSWICKDCAVLTGGQFYCADSCIDKPKATHPTPAPVRRTRILNPRKLALPAALVFGLCCLAFGVWQMQRNSVLQAENRELREQRLGLISALKDDRREISSLQETIDSDAARPAPRPRTATPALPPQALFGLPASFDRGSADKPLVCLTFDGGAHANAAFDILDTLRSRNVRATMFLSGEFMRRFPQLVNRIVAEGHEAANHTYSHPHLTSWETDQTHTTLPRVTAQLVADELSRTDVLFEKITGRRCAPLWRAPYGEKNVRICVWGQQAGYLHVGWGQGRTWSRNLDSNDWVPDEESAAYRSPQQVLDKITAIASQQPHGINGGIILLHLGTVRKRPDQQVHRVLGTLIDRLQGSGYRFVTVSEMLAESGVDTAVLRRQSSR